MRILIITQHYWPETVGTARRAQLVAEFLARTGNNMEVLCGIPNHPSMAHLFSDRFDGPENHNGVFIHRIPVFRTSTRWTATRPRPGLSPLPCRLRSRTASRPPRSSESRPDKHKRLSLPAKVLRSATYLHWMAQASATVTTRPGNWDVALAISPLPTAVAGIMLATVHHIPLILDVQDIWPDAAVKAGLISNRFLIRFLGTIEKWVYGRCAAIAVLSPDFANNILRKSRAFAPRVHLVPNAVDPAPHLAVEPSSLRDTWGLTPDDTLVIYTGNLGIVQDLDSLLEAAEALRHIERIHFVFVGDGVDKMRLCHLVQKKRLSRVRFEPHRPIDEIPSYLAAADVCFLSLRESAHTTGTIPSKLYEYLAAGKPVINMVPGDTARTIDEAMAGFNLDPGDVSALRVAILALHADPELRSRLGTNGKEYVTCTASIEVIGRKYEVLISQVVNENDKTRNSRG